jgi:L,D-peptidoglycan transpeptidase YkuD (ErfK/YbiS/YcfS/YnhG family)
MDQHGQSSRRLQRRSVLAVALGGLLHSAGAGASHGRAREHDLVVTGKGLAQFGHKQYRCAVGYSGVSRHKREGDGATPAGSWPIRNIYFRADRLALPPMRFRQQAIAADDAWCDAPDDDNYNRPVKLPYRASTEPLWRNDHVYDVFAVLGYNDDPVKPGLGSAIFLHLARDNYEPTSGCVALAREHLLEFLTQADVATRVVVAS